MRERERERETLIGDRHIGGGSKEKGVDESDEASGSDERESLIGDRDMGGGRGCGRNGERKRIKRLNFRCR